MSSSFSIGDSVQFLSRVVGGKSFQATGNIIALTSLKVRGKKKKAAVLSFDKKSKYYKLRKKTETTVCLHNLKKAGDK